MVQHRLTGLTARARKVRKVPKFRLGALESCIIEHESSGERYAMNGENESYYQWSPATWRYAEHVVGHYYSWLARDADLEAQTLTFRRYWPGHESEWSTAPLCS